MFNIDAAALAEEEALAALAQVQRCLLTREAKEEADKAEDLELAEAAAREADEELARAAARRQQRLQHLELAGAAAREAAREAKELMDAEEDLELAEAANEDAMEAPYGDIGAASELLDV